ncbi:hypothetical protein [Streptomyces sp. x-80]|uniref:hypothetical protein n=1 Tax=Streptomyces sp. x-80 TaxID=2789282 RepID=UPI0039801D4D
MTERGEDAATAQGTAAATDPFAGTPYEGSPEGWWTPHGGALDQASGVVYVPPGPRRHATPKRPTPLVRVIGQYGWAAFVSVVIIAAVLIPALALSGRL